MNEEAKSCANCKNSPRANTTFRRCNIKKAYFDKRHCCVLWQARKETTKWTDISEER